MWPFKELIIFKLYEPGGFHMLILVFSATKTTRVGVGLIFTRRLRRRLYIARNSDRVVWFLCVLYHVNLYESEECLCSFNLDKVNQHVCSSTVICLILSTHSIISYLSFLLTVSLWLTIPKKEDISLVYQYLEMNNNKRSEKIRKRSYKLWLTTTDTLTVSVRTVKRIIDGVDGDGACLGPACDKRKNISKCKNYTQMIKCWFRLSNIWNWFIAIVLGLQRAV